jgi:hypothetical protein
MAWRDKRKLNNTSVAMMPAPPSPQGPQLVSGPPWVGIIIVGFLCFVALAPLTWWAGVFLFEQAGFRQPERALAELLIMAGIILPILAVVALIAERILARIHVHQQAMAQIDLEAKRLTTLAAGAPALPDGRLTEEQKRLFEHLAVVMRQAYQDIADKVAPYPNGNVQRPWSRNAVIDMPPLPRHGKMPERQAIKVREWLEFHNVIVGDLQSDQVNEALYPTWEDFRALLEEKFNMTIRLTLTPGHSPTGLIGRYDDIDV